MHSKQQTTLALLQSALAEALAVLLQLNSVDLGNQGSDQLESGMHSQSGSILKPCVYSVLQLKQRKLKAGLRQWEKEPMLPVELKAPAHPGCLAPEALLEPKPRLAGQRRHMVVCPREPVVSEMAVVYWSWLQTAGGLPPFK